VAAISWVSALGALRHGTKNLNNLRRLFYGFDPKKKSYTWTIQWKIRTMYHVSFEANGNTSAWDRTDTIQPKMINY
jgi:hypothetical protein